MLEFDLIEAVAGHMVTRMYEALSISHKYAINNTGLTESGADEAVRIAIDKLYKAMKEADATVYYDTDSIKMKEVDNE